MRQEIIEQELRQLIARYIAEIKGAKAQGRQDNAVLSEGAWIPILKILFCCPDLVNLNSEQRNYPAIDLGDLSKRIAFQVTSQIDQDKVTDTLQKFNRHGLSVKFQRLIIFMLQEKKKQYSQKVCDKTLSGVVSFDVNSDIVDPYSLLRITAELSLNRQEQVLIHLQQMMGELLGPQVNETITDQRKTVMFRERALWSHETTNDERYVDRTIYLERMNHWANDSSVRAIAVTGMGGVGKTSMVGHWLKENSNSISRPVEGLFFWSFYIKRDVSEFIRALCQYIESISDVEFKSQTSSSPHSYQSLKKVAGYQSIDTRDALDVFVSKFHQLPPIIVVLDGLEVLQEAIREGTSYGAFIDAMLRDFILHVTSADKPWLCVTTSRFPLTDIADKKQIKALDVSGVTKEEGAAILHRRQIYGALGDRENISSFYDGHPFALLIFAASVPDELRVTPMVHFRDVTEGLSSDLFGEKLGGLMTYYKKRINPIQLQIVSALSMFRSPVVLSTLISLTKRFIDSEKGSSIDSRITTELFLLTGLGLIIRDNIEGSNVYGCHPIMREFFNNDALSSNKNLGQIVTQFLVNQPDSAGIVGVSSIEKFKVSIEALLKSGDLALAEQLYRDRLDSGGIFIRLGVPKEAKQVYQHFMDYYSGTPNKHKKNFEAYVVKEYINPFIEFCIQLAEYERAESLLAISLKTKNQAVCHRWIARILFSQGNYTSAIDECYKAIKIDSIRVTTGSGQAESLAITYYLLIRTLLAQGLEKQAKNELQNLEEYKQYFDAKYADSEVVPLLCKLMIATQCGDKELVRRVIHKCISRLEKVASAFFQDEIKLVIVEAHLLRCEYATAFQLAKEVYKKAVKESNPYSMCKSGLLIGRIEEKDGGMLNHIKISEMIDIARANKMWPIVIEGLLLLAASSVLEESKKQEYIDEAHIIANTYGIHI